MHKFSPRAAKAAVAATAVVLSGGFATYAAAQVSTKPAPQVVIPRSSATDNHGAKQPGADDRPRHDVNDDKGGATVGSDDPAGHDVNDDKGGATVGSDDPAGHDVNDDKGGNAVTPTTSPKSSTPTTVDDHGGNAVTPTTSPKSSTPTTVDDHGGNRGGGSGSRGHGSDG
jgi:hypothetical protein